MYKREQVFEETLKYFNGDELATNVWIDKYDMKMGEDFKELIPDDMHRRLAKEFARIEAKYPNPMNEEEIYQILKGFKYIVPAGSPMAGIGNKESKISTSNCFVIGGFSDSYSGILKADEELMQLMKRRGGVGIDISFIRPANAMANGTPLGEDVGATLYMERYSNATKEVQQGGRRGALLLAISINHPDAEKFIDKKMTPGKVEGANVSVKITDEFMHYVKTGEDFIQTFPVDLNIGTHTAFQESLANGDIEYDKLYPLQYKNDDEYKGCYAKRINPRKLWNKIMHNAHKAAEPGVLFWDTILKESPAAAYGKEWKEVSTNPCFSGDSKLLTTKGEVSFKKLAKEETVEILNKDGDISLGRVWKTGIKNVIELKDSQKQSKICTPDHEWMTVEGDVVEAKDLLGRRLMPFINKKKDHDDLFIKLGFIQGDGNLSRLNSNPHKGLEINIGSKDRDVLAFFGYKESDTGSGGRSIYTSEFSNRLKDMGFDLKILPERGLPRDILNWSKKQKLSFLKGLFSANGSVIGSSRVSLKTTSFSLVEGLTELLKELGYSSYFTTNKPKKVKFANGEYLCKESYDINIGRFFDLIKFFNEIGFIHGYKTESLRKTILKRSPKITKITQKDSCEVYDYNEPIVNWGVVDGYIASNCGEIPLCPEDSCRLTALNLYSYIYQAFTEGAMLEDDLLIDHVKKGIRLMDDLVDLEIEKIDAIIEKIKLDNVPFSEKERELSLWTKIRNKATGGRRIGFGVLGEADLIAGLGLRYGTPEATEFSEKLHQLIATSAYESSIELAKERGAFPVWSSEDIHRSDFLHRMFMDNDLMSKKTFDDYLRHGRRNIGLLTIAPTGSSAILTQTSSGLEPVFMPFYYRKRKVSGDKFDFQDESGEKWEENIVLHKPFVDWFAVDNELDFNEAREFLINSTKEDIQIYFEKSPYFKATSRDVDYLEKVRMQGKVQKWVDHSISVTVNMPEDVSEDMVGEVYKKAYEEGCKGITVYREGSRGNVLSSTSVKENSDKFEYVAAKNRPKTLPCDVYFRTSRGEDFVVFVGILQNKPYEIFSIPYETGILPKRVEKGTITKVKKKHWQFVSKDGKYTIDNLQDKMLETEQNETRTLSAMLRHRMDPADIAKIISKYATISSFHKVIEKVLLLYTDKGKLKEMCPECSAENLSYEDGCLICKSCGYSKCS